MTPSEEFVHARYGMFIHYGLYSLLERAEWVLNREQIPIDEYRKLADRFTAEHFDATALCDLAVRAGMRYIVLTTMHHDGFRLYDTALSDFSTAKTAAKRDLVAELVKAARARGLRIGLYHSLNNWTDQPDSVAALESRSHAPGGTGETGDWNAAREFVATAKRPVLLAGGLTPENVAAAIGERSLRGSSRMSGRQRVVVATSTRPLPLSATYTPSASAATA